MPVHMPAQNPLNSCAGYATGRVESFGLRRMARITARTLVLETLGSRSVMCEPRESAGRFEVDHPPQQRVSLRRCPPT